MSKKITIQCEHCGEEFDRELREYKRSKKNGRKSYCSRNCSGHANVGNIPEEKRGQTIFLKPRNKRDEFSPFRYHLRKAKSRNQDCDLTLEYLKEVWENQDGKCIYTGVKMTEWNHSSKNGIYTASLDRIDSSKGYVEGNVQFISRNVNYMKNTLTHNETVKLCKIIAEFWN